MNTDMKKANWGGARKGSGRKPAAYEPSASEVDYELAKARNETAKANLNELEYQVKLSTYVLRAEVRMAAATALAALSQSLRSVQDNIERKLGVSPEVAQEVGDLIDVALNSVADEFERMGTAAKLGEEDATE